MLFANKNLLYITDIKIKLTDAIAPAIRRYTVIFKDSLKKEKADTKIMIKRGMEDSENIYSTVRENLSIIFSLLESM